MYLNAKKYSLSIAEEIYIPFLPKQITKRHKSCKSRSKDTKVHIVLFYVNTNSYTKFKVNFLEDDR